MPPRDGPPRSAHLPAGYDEDDPYEDEDLDAYPDWWREGVETFREHGMRPYRPPRFADGELMPEVVDRLEADLGVEIRVRTTAPETGSWEVWVDGDPAGTVDRRRDGDGYTVYELSADEFEALVRETAEG